MGRHAKKIVVKESIDDLKKRMQKEKNHRLRERIQLLIMLKEESLIQEVAAFRLGIGKSTINRWLKLYEKEGIDNLLQINSGGKRRETITAEMHLLLEEKLHDSHAPLMGYKDAVDWLEKTHGTRVPYTTLYTYLKKEFGSKLKTPRKSHYKKSEAAIEVFKKTA